MKQENCLWQYNISEHLYQEYCEKKLNEKDMAYIYQYKALSDYYDIVRLLFERTYQVYILKDAREFEGMHSLSFTLLSTFLQFFSPVGVAVTVVSAVSNTITSKHERSLQVNKFLSFFNSPEGPYGIFHQFAKQMTLRLREDILECADGKSNDRAQLPLNIEACSIMEEENKVHEEAFEDFVYTLNGFFNSDETEYGSRMNKKSKIAFLVDLALEEKYKRKGFQNVKVCDLLTHEEIDHPIYRESTPLPTSPLLACTKKKSGERDGRAKQIMKFDAVKHLDEKHKINPATMKRLKEKLIDYISEILELSTSLIKQHFIKQFLYKCRIRDKLAGLSALKERLEMPGKIDFNMITEIEHEYKKLYDASGQSRVWCLFNKVKQFVKVNQEDLQKLENKIYTYSP